MDLLTIRGQLLSAVRALSTEAGTIDQRLRSAYELSLRGLPCQPEFPHHIQPECEALMAELADIFRVPGPVDTARASKLAKRVVTLYERVVKER